MLIISGLWLAFICSTLGLTLLLFFFFFRTNMQQSLALLHIYLSYCHTSWNTSKDYMTSMWVHEAQRDVTHLATGDTTSVVLFKKPVFVLFLLLSIGLFFPQCFKSKGTLMPVGKCVSPFFSDGQKNIWRRFVWNSWEGNALMFCTG